MTMLPMLTPYLSHSHKSTSNLVRSVAATVLEKISKLCLSES